jgi:hypothetical protein
MSVFLLFAFGALLATSYIMIHSPGCLQIPGWSSPSSSSSSSNPETVSEKDTQQQQQLRTPPSTTAAAQPEAKEAPAPAPVAAKVAATPTAAKVTATPAAAKVAATPTAAKVTATPAEAKVAATPAAAPKPAPVPTLPSNLPKACDRHVLWTLKHQLPEAGCLGSPSTQSCSFTQATKGCHNPFWMRDHYAKTGLMLNFMHKFIAVQVGCTKTQDFMMDALAIGSHKATYPAKVATWQTGGGVQCKLPAVVGASTTEQPAQVVCLQHDPAIAADLKSMSTNLGLKDSEFTIVTAKMSNIPGAAVNGVPTSTLDKTLAETFPDQTQPIHYLKIEESGMEAEILSGSTQTLDRVRYLEFGYHYEGNWKNENLESLVQSRLAQKNGFVCYWHGSDGNLWRITDCWQAHYNRHSRGFIACVSSKHADAKPILDKMEEQFATTLKKDLKFD